MHAHLCCLALALLLVAGTVVAAAEPAIAYPPTRKAETADDLHGTKVPDPYRWLEDDVRKSPDVAAWVEAQNKVTFGFLEAIPERDPIKKRLTELWNYERFSVPFKVAGRTFFSKNDGLQNQAVFYTQGPNDAEPRVLLDPNTMSKDGTVALTGMSVSDDAKYLAYGTASAGSDWQTWHVLDVATGKPLSDELKWIKFSSASWTNDGRGFFYSRYDEPKGQGEFTGLNLNQKVFYHRLGSPQADDVLVYRRPDQPEWGFSNTVSEDGRYLVMSTFKGTDPRNRVTYRDLTEPYALAVDLIDNLDHEYDFLGNDGPVFFFKTDFNAPKGRIIAIDTRDPAPEKWKELVPEAKDSLNGVSVVGNLFVLSYLKDAATQVKVYQLDGTFVRDVALPGIGTAGGFGGRRTDTETFYSFSSFATPPSIFRYDLITGTSKLFRQAKVKIDPSRYEVKQVFVTSKDGTKVPMFLTYRKGLELNGDNPTLLYGYGGFNIPLTPNFSVSRAMWLEMGGVYAQVCLRGGGEYGKDWHQAGTKLRKQNVFDDCVAAAQWLIDQKYTRPAKLALEGRSNGGLLVGAVINQRPDLFGAALPGVGVMDMLRFQKFTAGRFWVDDYGSSDDPDQFKALFAYSPYHNLKKGTRYPAVMVTTADTDDRVVPGHSFKYAARLQEYQAAGGPPVLIRIETKAGHGAGKPTSKAIEELADEYAFLVKVFGMKLPPG